MYNFHIYTVSSSLSKVYRVLKKSLKKLTGEMEGLYASRGLKVTIQLVAANHLCNEKYRVIPQMKYSVIIHLIDVMTFVLNGIIQKNWICIIFASSIKWTFHVLGCDLSVHTVTLIATTTCVFDISWSFYRLSFKTTCMSLHFLCNVFIFLEMITFYPISVRIKHPVFVIIIMDCDRMICVIFYPFSCDILLLWISL